MTETKSCSAKPATFVPTNDLERHELQFAGKVDAKGTVTKAGIYESGVRKGLTPCEADFLARAFTDPYTCSGGTFSVSAALTQTRGSNGLNVWDSKGMFNKKLFDAAFAAIDTDSDGKATLGEIEKRMQTIFPQFADYKQAGDPKSDFNQYNRLDYGFRLIFNDLHATDAWASAKAGPASTQNDYEVPALSRAGLTSFYKGHLLSENRYKGVIPAEASLTCSGAPMSEAPPLPPPPVCSPAAK